MSSLGSGDADSDLDEKQNEARHIGRRSTSSDGKGSSPGASGGDVSSDVHPRGDSQKRRKSEECSGSSGYHSRDTSQDDEISRLVLL